MNEINKDEILDLKKWQRFFFMVIYSFAINAVVNILIILAVLQSFFISSLLGPMLRFNQ